MKKDTGEDNCTAATREGIGEVSPGVSTGIVRGQSRGGVGGFGGQKEESGQVKRSACQERQGAGPIRIKRGMMRLVLFFLSPESCESCVNISEQEEGERNSV